MPEQQTTTRAEHIEQSKNLALRVLETGDPKEAMACMFAELTKHHETRDHDFITLGINLQMVGDLKTYSGVKKFIEGFH